MGKITKDYYEEADGELNTIIYGDTDSIFLHVEAYASKMCKEKLGEDLDKLTEDQIIEVIDDIILYVTDKINNDYIANFSSAFGIKSKYNRMNFKSEITASCTYFLNVKKKYALKVVSVEGNRVDKFDVKGLEVRRSDYSTFSKKLVGDVVYDYILQKKSLSSIVEFIGDKKVEAIELLESGDPSVSIPKNYNKNVEDYKQVPGHVKAMLFYNEIVGKEEFRQGSKGYLFYIKGIDHSIAPKDVANRFENYIGPKQAVVIPFGQKIQEYLIIDVEKMMEGVYTKRLSNLLQPMDIVINAGTIEENLELEF